MFRRFQLGLQLARESVLSASIRTVIDVSRVSRTINESVNTLQAVRWIFFSLKSEMILCLSPWICIYMSFDNQWCDWLKDGTRTGVTYLDLQNHDVIIRNSKE